MKTHVRIPISANSLDFKITKDDGHFNHWKYSVEYRERLSHWPYWLNVAEADYEVRKLDADESGDYIVSSNHRTCFAAGLYCRKLGSNHSLKIRESFYFFVFFNHFSIILCDGSLLDGRVSFHRHWLRHILRGKHSISVSTIFR